MSACCVDSISSPIATAGRAVPRAKEEAVVPEAPQVMVAMVASLENLRAEKK
jgi:hypothetical protein